MHFDGTITLGNVLTLVTTLLAILSVAWKFGQRFSQIEFKVSLIWKWFEREHGITAETPTKGKK